MASPEPNDGDRIVELIVRDASDSAGDADAEAVAVSEVFARFTQPERPRINIFTDSYTRRKSRDEVTRLLESEPSSLTRFILWISSGSRYSGLLCMVLSSTTYFLMEVLSNIFSVQAIPLFEAAFTRCTVMLVLSYIWLRRGEQPLFATSHVRNILISRALVGCLSLSSFVYCVQRLPFSQAIVLNLTTPIMASILARLFLHEKLKIADIAGLACSFFGVLFFFHEMLATQGRVVSILSLMNTVTILTFSMLSSLVMAIFTFFFEDFVLPGFWSIILMLVLSVLAFFAEVLLARRLQLERIGKIVNVLYLEAILFSQAIPFS